ncbi:uncharacterized protein LOC134185675 isoform X2 [Corticium candelabrum]|uniref:uncharacterized protein LOC134185675 isoform X2 n=1 Tax=Corticium candelabrum TaxID=121492 RepID=UPI002E26D5AB|nr:uncharacterized protein LOC134185675 isoform X2 [Corticium candelabrum]
MGRKKGTKGQKKGWDKKPRQKQQVPKTSSSRSDDEDVSKKLEETDTQREQDAAVDTQDEDNDSGAAAASRIGETESDMGRVVEAKDDEEWCENPPFKVPFPLAIWDFGECDPKKCTGRRLLRKGIVRKLHFDQRFYGIVLSPLADTHISPADKDLIAQLGLAVIDCSWAELKASKFDRIRARNTRLLPFMIATNPVKYGTAFTLSCAEALAGALAIVGFESYAEAIMSHFNWGLHFLPMNEEPFKLYKKCRSSSGVTVAQSKFLKEVRETPVDDEFLATDLNVRELFADIQPDTYNPNRSKVKGPILPPSYDSMESSSNAVVKRFTVGDRTVSERIEELSIEEIEAEGQMRSRARHHLDEMRAEERMAMESMVDNDRERRKRMRIKELIDEENRLLAEDRRKDVEKAGHGHKNGKDDDDEDEDEDDDESERDGLEEEDEGDGSEEDNGQTNDTSNRLNRLDALYSKEAYEVD